MKALRSLVWAAVVSGAMMSDKVHAVDLYKCETVVEMDNGKLSAERSLYANGAYFGQYAYWNGFDSAVHDTFLRLGLFMAPTRLSGTAQKTVLSMRRINKKGKKHKFRKHALLRITSEGADQYLDIKRRYESSWADFNIDMDELLTIFADHRQVTMSVYEPGKTRAYEKTDVLELDLAVVESVNKALAQATIKLDEMHMDHENICVPNFGSDGSNEVGEVDDVIIFSER